MNQNSTYLWYQELTKPSWAPPSWLFGPVWSILYILIGVSFGYVFFHIWKKKLPFKAVYPFIINLISNALFTPIQFGLRNYALAAVDIIVVLLTIVWIIKLMYKQKKYRWVAYMQIPYFLWVSFATILQLTITYLNK